MNPTQFADTDSDGYGDNPSGITQMLSDDATEWDDSDNDLGDNADTFFIQLQYRPKILPLLW